ncbi:hypothetical protein FRC03_007919 [Tulasnella sp. 419]|nr:hypothetical protein FRC02_011701 [Tulasnella sp. 418]KAG8959492.1 hypothetical protein FRC03_007919 [Tulasnella sp. 419]
MAPKKQKDAREQVSTLSSEKLAELEAGKSKAIDALREPKLFQAWPINKSPGWRRTFVPGNKRRKLSLPRGYRSKEYDLIDVRPGDELNEIVYRYYNERLTNEVREKALAADQARRRKLQRGGSSDMDGWVDGGGFGINYVAGEGVIQRRHENLGPSPMVAGFKYLFSLDHDIRILWWDSFLQDRWSETETWDVDVKIRMSSKGEGEWTLVQT